jgi:pantothenate kinase
MSTTESLHTLTREELIDEARRLADADGRRILGLTGPPGVGKSELAATLVRALHPQALLVPMDGFHLAQAELTRLGRDDRKGAPDTFDAAGYVSLLRRLRDPDEQLVYAPLFRREIEEPVAGAIAIPRQLQLVVTEGNYLLLAESDWAPVADLLDEVWYLELDEETRIERLIARHVEYGKTPSIARAWALGSDQRNARVVKENRARADRIIRVAEDTPGSPSRADGSRSSG